mgnify:CR=1 FL=1
MGIAGRKRVETNYRVEDEATRLIEFLVPYNGSGLRDLSRIENA